MTHRIMFVGTLFLACGWLQAQDRETLTMAGGGMAYAVPDRANVELDVTSVDTDPHDALSSNKKAVKNALEKINAYKIDQKNVSTSAVGIEPLSFASGTDLQYIASTTLRLTGLPLTNLGVVLDRIVTSDVHGLRVSFYASVPDSVESLAIANAVVDATSKATKFADTFKLRLGKLINLKAECSAVESMTSMREGSFNIYKASEASKFVLVVPPRVTYSAKVEAVFAFTAKE